MRHDDAVEVDLHRLLGLLAAAPPAADQDTLERLLAGRLDPREAPPADAGLAGLLAAASGPASPEELPGEQVVLAEFAAVQSDLPSLAPRRANVLSRLARVKAAAAVLAALLSIGGVAAAATGRLPGQAQRTADQASSTTAAGAAGREVGAAAVAGLDGAAKQGLCRVWQAGQATDQGRRAEAPAFRALTVAAGVPTTSPATAPRPPPTARA
jgi:hypothetical protein